MTGSRNIRSGCAPASVSASMSFRAVSSLLPVTDGIPSSPIARATTFAPVSTTTDSRASSFSCSQVIELIIGVLSPV